MKTLTFNIYNINFLLQTNSDFIFKNLSKDFALYLNPSASTDKPHVCISVLLEPPPYQRIPPIDAALHGEGLICYKQGNTNFVTYSPGGLLIYDFAKETGELFGADEVFLYEKAKLTIHSRIGELLDHQGLHRIHAFGVTLNNKTLIGLLPTEAGKTTTVLNLLKMNPDIKILADDVCFIDKNNTIYPFLLQIGARNKDLVENFPQEFITEIHRNFHDVKYFIDPNLFKARLASQTKLTHLLVGKRAFRPETTITPLAKFKALGPVMESGVFGVGLPQLLEFFVRGDFKLFSERILTILARVFFCIGLVFKTKTYSITIGLDKDASCKEILGLLNGGSR